MRDASSQARHTRRLAAWCLFFLLAVLLVALPGDWLTASFNGRHFLVVAAAVGVVLETERWKP